MDSVLYGPSTQKKIERWWRELHHRMEKFFKEQLAVLAGGGGYDSSNTTDRYNLKTLVILFIVLIMG